DDKMNKLKGAVSAKGVERVAVMAAISIASDLLALRRKQEEDGSIPVDAVRARIRELNDRADEALRQYAHVGTRCTRPLRETRNQTCRKHLNCAAPATYHRM